MPKIIVSLTFNVKCKAKFRYFTVALMLFYTMKNILTCVVYFGNVYYQTAFKEPVLDVDSVSELTLSTFWCDLYYII
jgi:hypothetical protein